MKKYVYILLGLAVFIGVVFIIVTPAKASIYDGFAKCIKASGATFYGAWWCPHCAAQKARFGTAVQYLPYVECSNPDKSQNQTCDNAGITTYPTWQFPAVGLDGVATTTRHIGEMELVDLAKATSCPLPTQ